MAILTHNAVFSSIVRLRLALHSTPIAERLEFSKEIFCRRILWGIGANCLGVFVVLAFLLKRTSDFCSEVEQNDVFSIIFKLIASTCDVAE